MEKGAGSKLTDAFQRHWLALVLLFWVGIAIYLFWDKWGGIQAFHLWDTDDNLRMMQVRALLDGQGWWDLRQHRMNLPDGLNVHWSRLVDLPIAGFYLLLEPVIGHDEAERWATSFAPLLPLLIALWALALTARRLLSPYAHWLGLALVFFCGSAVAMFAPLRIDHHGWQLAMLAVAVAGLADPRRGRGGVTLGVASALSLSIGLEMLLYLGVAGAAVGLSWVHDTGEGRRLAAYGVSFAGAAALGYLVFGSYDNGAPVCDALSPVWLSVVLFAGAIAVALAWLSPGSMWLRLGAAALAAMLLVGFYALAWPHCLGRLEGVPEELDRLWLSNVREAMPLYRHGLETSLSIATLPVIGLIGYLLMLWRTRRDPALLARWAGVAAMGGLAAVLLLWQTRAAAASQILAVPGAAGLGWVLIGWFMRQKHMLVRVLGTGAVFLVVSGAIVLEAFGWFKAEEAPNPRLQAINNANWRCHQQWALRPLGQHPKGYVLTFVDMGPRLIATTHHDAITGPYHRNVQEILDVMRAFRGDAANAKGIIDRRRIDYVLLCPNMSESTLYSSGAPQGWYMQLVNGQVPAWLEPMRLPADSPFRMWRVRR